MTLWRGGAGFEFRVYGLWFMIYDLVFRVQGSGTRVEG